MTGLNLSGLRPLDTSTLQAVEDEAPIDVSALRPLDVSGLRPADPAPQSVPFGSLMRGYNRLQQQANLGGYLTGAMSADDAAALIAANEADLARTPPSTAVQQGLEEIGAAEGFLPAAGAILRNPSAVISTVGESLASSAPSIAGSVAGGLVGSLAGPVGAAVGMAAGAAPGSFSTEYASTVLDTLRDGGVNLADKAAVAAGLQNPELMAEAQRRGVARGIPITIMDVASAGVAGRVFAPAARTAEKLGAGTVGGKVAGGVAELGVQGTAGSLGEAGAQIADEGKITSPGDVLLEFAGEAVSGVGESAVGAALHRRAQAGNAPPQIAGAVQADEVSQPASPIETVARETVPSVEPPADAPRPGTEFGLAFEYVDPETDARTPGLDRGVVTGFDPETQTVLYRIEGGREDQAIPFDEFRTVAREAPAPAAEPELSLRQAALATQDEVENLATEAPPIADEINDWMAAGDAEPAGAPGPGTQTGLSLVGPARVVPRAVYVERVTSRTGASVPVAEQAHKLQVMQSLANGVRLPDEILADYRTDADVLRVLAEAPATQQDRAAFTAAQGPLGQAAEQGLVRGGGNPAFEATDVTPGPLGQAAREGRINQGPVNPAFEATSAPNLEAKYNDLLKLIETSRISLTAPARLAKALRTSERAVTGLLQRAYQSGAIARTDDGRFYRKPKPGQPAREGETILQFISRLGGIQDQQGDLRALGLEAWHRGQRPGTKRLINPKGLTADDLTQRAIEEGFLPPAGPDQPFVDASRLFDLIQQQSQVETTGRGAPVMRPGDLDAYLRRMEQQDSDEALAFLESRAENLGEPGRRPLESLDAFAARLDEADAERAALQDEGSFDDTAVDEDVPFDDTRFQRGTSPAPFQGPSFRIADDLTGTASASLTDTRNAVAEAVMRVLNRMIGPRASVVVTDRLFDRQGGEVLGAYSRNSIAGRLVSIAMLGPDPIGTARHEAIHWMRDAGLIDDKAWSVLSRAAERGRWAERFGIDGRYGDLTPEQRTEEAIADAAQAFGNGTLRARGAVAAALETINAFVERLGNALRGLGYRSADDVFRAIDGGLYAERGSSVVDPSGDVIGTYNSPEEARAAAVRMAEAERVNAEAIMASDQVYDRLAADTSPAPARATAYQREAPPAGLDTPDGSRLWNLGKLGRAFNFPRAIAMKDRMFARYWNARRREQAITETLLQRYTNMVPDYARLSDAEKSAIHKIEEADRNAGNVRDRDYGGRLVVRLPDGPIMLTPAATKAFFQRRRLFAKMWRDQAREYGRLMGFSGPLTEEGFAAHLAAADRPGVSRADRAYAGRTVEFLRNFLRSERAGYVPYMRYGNQKIAVRPKRAEEGFPEVVHFELIEAPPWRNLIGGSAKTTSVEVQAKIAELRKKYPASDFDISTGEITAKDEELLDPDTLAQFLQRFAQRKDQIVVDVKPTPAQIARAKANIAARYGWEGPSTDKELETLEKIQRDAGNVTDADRISALRDELAGFDESLKNGERMDLGDYLLNDLRDEVHAHLERKFLRKAKNTPGYSLDFERATGDYIRSVAGSVARSQTREDRDSALFDLRKRTTDGMAKYVDWFDRRMDDPTVSDFAQLRQIGFFTFLAASPGGALVNLSQTPVVTATALGKIAGVARGQKAAYEGLMRALRGSTFRDGQFTIDVDRIGATPAERAFLRALLEDGTLQAQLTQDLQGMQDLAGTRLREIGAVRGANAKLQKVLALLSSTFGWSEQINRAGVALATYRLAQSEAVRTKAASVHADNELFREMVRTGGMTPETIARFMVDDTQFVGGKLNRPMAMSGPGALVFQFKQFPFQVLGLMLRQMKSEGKEGRIAAGMMLATFFLLAGAYGPPFAEDLKDGLEWFLKEMTGVDRDLDREFRAMVSDLVGTSEDDGWGAYLAETILRGPTRLLTGIDLGGRLGMGNIAPDPTLTDFLGVPFAGLIGLPWQAYQYAQTERPASAAASLIPIKGVRDAALAATALPEEGVTTRRGAVVIQPEQVTAADQVKRGLGLQPADFARTRERAYSQQRVQNSTKEATGRYADTIARLESNAISAENAGNAARAARLFAQADKVRAEAQSRYESVLAAADEAEKKGNRSRAAQLRAQAVAPPSKSALQIRRNSNLDLEASQVQRGARLKREELSSPPFPDR